jgi:hypothetical protein
VFSCAAGQESAVGGDDIHRDQIVDGEATLAHQPAQAASEREARNTRRRNLAPGRGQAKGLRLVVELSPGQAGLGLHRASRGVDADALHRRQVDHQTAVADGIAGDVVTAAPHGDEQVVGSRKVHRADDVGGPGTAGDQGRFAVDGAVPDASRDVVAGVAGL